MASVIQYRRLSRFLLGNWLGAWILRDFAPTWNVEAVDQLLQEPGDPATSIRLNRMGVDKARVILRRNTGEGNNRIVTNWEWAQIVSGSLLLFVLLFGKRPQMLIVIPCVAMIAFVPAEHFALTPQIEDLGLVVDDLPANDPAARKFRTAQWFYSGVDLLKRALGFGVAAQIVFRRHADKEILAREYAASSAIQGKAKRG